MHASVPTTLPWLVICAFMLTPFMLTRRRLFPAVRVAPCQGVGLAVADMIFDGGFDGRDGGFDGGFDGGYDGGYDGGFDGGFDGGW